MKSSAIKAMVAPSHYPFPKMKEELGGDGDDDDDDDAAVDHFLEVQFPDIIQRRDLYASQPLD